MKKSYVTIPNMLSLSRIAFLPLLFFFVLTDMRSAFWVGYLLVGSTDFFDGLIARRFNMKSEIGKMLDSVADLFFYISSAFFLQRLYPHYLAPNTTLLIVFFSLLGVSFLVSAIRCKKPILMHTFLLRLNAVLVYILILASHFVDTTLFITVILGIYLVGFLEEIVIFIKYGQIDPDTPSLFHVQNDASDKP